jgi:hypothetical protein
MFATPVRRQIGVASWPIVEKRNRFFSVCAYRKSHSAAFTNVTLLHCAQKLATISSPGTHSRIYLCAQPQNACVRPCYPMRQNPQKCCLPCRLGTIIDFRVGGRHFAPALAKRSVKQTPHCLAAHGEHTASKKLAQFALRFRTEIHHFAWRLLLKCRFWRKLCRLEGLLKRCFLGEVLFPARTALCKI